MRNKFKQKISKRTWWILGSLIAINVFIIILTLLIKGQNSNWDMKIAGKYLLDQVYLNNFFKQPALVLGFITLIGYLIMGRDIKDSILGSLKCVIGYVLLSIGSGTLVGLAKPVFVEISKIGGTTVVPLDPYLGWTSANHFLGNFKTVSNYVSLTTYVFIVGFIVNILLVIFKKWTNVNSLMITGHVMLQQAAIITAAFYVLMFGKIPLINNVEIRPEIQAGTVVITGIFLGSYWGIASSGTLKGTNKITNDAGFAIGHQQMLTIALAYKLSRFFGSPENSSENRKMPKFLKIFEDNIFVQTTIITLLFMILFIILIGNKTLHLDGDFFDKNSDIGGQWNKPFDGAHWFLNIFGGSIKLIAALICMMSGVRMFVTELQQSFTGISEKLIKDAVIAVDIAAVYGFAPNSVTFGFASGTIAQFLGTGITIGLSLIPNTGIVIIIPLFVTLFFNSGAIGPYANAAGGFKATIIVPAIIGFVEIIVISLGLWAFSNSYSSLGSAIEPLTRYDVMDGWQSKISPEDLNIIKSNLIFEQDKMIILKSSPKIDEIIRNVNLNKSGIIKEISEWKPNPFETGYIGMGDWTLFFGSVMLISGWHEIIAWIFIPLSLMSLFAYGQIVDSGKQHKKTMLQKLLKLNPILIGEENENEK